MWIIQVLTLCMKWKHQSGEQQEMESSTAERRQPSQSEVHVLTVNTLTLLLLGYDLIQLWSDTCKETRRLMLMTDDRRKLLPVCPNLTGWLDFFFLIHSLLFGTHFSSHIIVLETFTSFNKTPQILLTLALNSLPDTSV